MGKWHIRQEPAGFDEWKALPGQGVYFDPDFIVNGQTQKHSGYATDITTDFALDFLRKGDPAKPFCLVYQHKAPHRPFTPAPRHAKMFDDIEWPYPETYDDDYSTRRIAEEAKDMRFEISLEGDYDDIPKGLDPEQKRNWIFQRFVKDHYRAVYGVDENLGQVLEYLDATGLAEDTLIIYTTDNGYFLGEHGWYDKRFMYEPSLRIPFLVRYPRLPIAGKVEERFAMNIDIAPTILDFAGIDIPQEMQGRSLRPLLEGDPAGGLAAVGLLFLLRKLLGIPRNGPRANDRPLVPVLDGPPGRTQPRCAYRPLQTHRVLHRRQLLGVVRPARRPQRAE